MDDFIIRFGKISKVRWNGAIKHNKRAIPHELQNGNINPENTPKNYTLWGAVDCKGVADSHNKRLEELKITKIRVNAVMALEIIINPPHNIEPDKHSTYFNDSLEWALNNFGEENVLSVDVHLDEATPHCHILIIPIIDGKLSGNKLMGGKKQIHQRRNSYYREVASKYGVPKPINLNYHNRQKIFNKLIRDMESNNDDLIKHPQWFLIRQSIEHNLKAWCEAYGLDMQKIIDDKNGIEGKNISIHKDNKITNSVLTIHSKNTKTLPCVSVLNFNINNSKDVINNLKDVVANEVDINQSNEITYVRDSELTNDKGYWDEASGEFIRYSLKKVSNYKKAVLGITREQKSEQIQS